MPDSTAYPARRLAPLAESTDRRLFAYGLVAGASMLAAAVPAGATVIYTNPGDVTITNGVAGVDIDGDGINDVNFGTGRINQASFGIQWLNAAAPQGGIKLSMSANYAAAKAASYTIGPANYFSNNAKMAYGSRSQIGSTLYLYTGGPWANVTDRFLGVQFTHDGNPVYGWVRMDVEVDPSNLNLSYTIKDWAYEDSGGSIHAGVPGVPEPGTLGLLALGSVALAAWRRRRKEQA